MSGFIIIDRMRYPWLVMSSMIATGCQLVTTGFGGDNGSTASATGGPSGTTGTTGAASMTTAPTSVAGAEGSGDTTAAATSTGDMTATGDATATGDTTEDEPASCRDDDGGCDPNATCNDDSGAVECTCNLGYEGDGQRCSVDAMLPTLRLEMPCQSQGRCNSAYCFISNDPTDQAVMTGNPVVSYEVTLRFRGVMEEKAYFGGTDDGLWNEGGSPADDGWNTYRLEISSPSQSYWLNSGSQFSDHCEMVDYEQTVTITGGATVSVAGFEPNDCGARNLDDDGQPIVIPGIDPAPAPFDGQFLQVDVVSVVPVP